MFSGNLELCASEISSPRQALIFGHFVYGQAGNWGQADGGHAEPDTHGQVFGSNLFCQIGHQTNLDHTYWHRKICSPPMNSLSNGHPQKLFGKIPILKKSIFLLKGGTFNNWQCKESMPQALLANRLPFSHVPPSPSPHSPLPPSSP